MFARIRKFLIAALGGVASIAALNVLPDRYQAWAVALVAAATAAGVYRVPNGTDATGRYDK